MFSLFSCRHSQQQNQSSYDADLGFRRRCRALCDKRHGKREHCQEPSKSLDDVHSNWGLPSSSLLWKKGLSASSERPFGFGFWSRKQLFIEIARHINARHKNQISTLTDRLILTRRERKRRKVSERNRIAILLSMAYRKTNFKTPPNVNEQQ